jgi:hypothetical protein
MAGWAFWYRLVPRCAVASAASLFFDFATNQSTTIAELGILALGLSASRDGRIVLFSQFEPPTGDLVMVENFM